MIWFGFFLLFRGVIYWGLHLWYRWCIGKRILIDEFSSLFFILRICIPECSHSNLLSPSWATHFDPPKMKNAILFTSQKDILYISLSSLKSLCNGLCLLISRSCCSEPYSPISDSNYLIISHAFHSLMQHALFSSPDSRDLIISPLPL